MIFLKILCFCFISVLTFDFFDCIFISESGKNRNLGQTGQETMKPIIEYSDFRKFMLDYYEERKRRSAFTWREFSKIARFTSPNYMKV